MLSGAYLDRAPDLLLEPGPLYRLSHARSIVEARTGLGSPAGGHLRHGGPASRQDGSEICFATPRTRSSKPSARSGPDSGHTLRRRWSAPHRGRGAPDRRAPRGLRYPGVAETVARVREDARCSWAPPGTWHGSEAALRRLRRPVLLGARSRRSGPRPGHVAVQSRSSPRRVAASGWTWPRFGCRHRSGRMRRLICEVCRPLRARRVRRQPARGGAPRRLRSAFGDYAHMIALARSEFRSSR